MEDKEVSSLNLVLPHQLRGVRKDKQFKHNCYFSQEHEHALHLRDNPQLNSLLDLTISQGLYLDECLQKLALQMNNLALQIDHLMELIQSCQEQNKQHLCQEIINLKISLNVHD